MIERFVDHLREHRELGRLVVHARHLPAREARTAPTQAPLPVGLSHALESCSIDALWTHQAQGVDLARAGRDVVLATPTASGKTLSFALPVLESAIADPRARGLFLYPTKALARDQLAGFRALSRGIGPLASPRFEIYDGDTSALERRRIKADPPSGLLTNPDMLHAGILANHADWAPLLRNLRWVVLDELHVYRGLFGAHVHHVLARLLRICRLYGANPQFIAASATIGNPSALAESLVGRPFAAITDSGAPRGGVHVLFVNPVAVSPYTVAVRIVAEAVAAGLKTIAFTKARRVTELLYSWIVRQHPELTRRIAPYRAGYLAEERRSIEARLFRGDLDAVLATSALELGIDVGGLDLCVLVGYPGSLVSAWQRAGRVARRGRQGLVVLVALPDALDQYVVRHPEVFFGERFEQAVLDPGNPLVAGQHFVCAAAEAPLAATEIEARGPQARALVDSLCRDGRLVAAADGHAWFSFRRRPHADVNPRSAGSPYTIADRRGKVLGGIDGVRVWRECHPGAIYLHGGQSFHVVELDQTRRRVVVEAVDADHYTVILGEKETEILETLDSARHGRFPVTLGRLRVTTRVNGYQKRRLFDGEPLSTHPLEAPPFVFETVGFWIDLPREYPAAFAARELHFMGGIHAVEHAMIGLFPLLLISDRGDVGGISYTGHPQTAGPAIFVYDGVAGGAGLSAQGFREIGELLKRTRSLVDECECEAGCPGCIQSPQCGNGNRPLDKEAARLVLALFAGADAIADREPESPTVARASPCEPRRERHGIRRHGNVEDPARVETDRAPVSPERVLVLDVETQRSADEVGGWGHISRLGLALAVVYEPLRESWRTYLERDVHRLLLDLVMADRVVGFNIDRFDLAVLAPYTDQDLSRIRTLDLLTEIHRRLGFRLSLAHLAESNLGIAKSADGLTSLRWWKEGRIDLIESYCRRDVEVTHALWRMGCDRGYLLYRDHARRAVRVPVAW